MAEKYNSKEDVFQRTTTIIRVFAYTFDYTAAIFQITTSVIRVFVCGFDSIAAMRYQVPPAPQRPETW